MLRCLREELTLHGETAPYVARLALVLLTSTAIYRYFHVRNGYWIPMTALLVLKPQWGNTLSRGIARMLGTVAGAGIALVLARLLPFPAWLLPTLVVVSAWGCYALQAVNYAVFSVFITLYIVVLVSFRRILGDIGGAHPAGKYDRGRRPGACDRYGVEDRDGRSRDDPREGRGLRTIEGL